MEGKQDGHEDVEVDEAVKQQQDHVELPNVTQAHGPRLHRCAHEAPRLMLKCNAHTGSTTLSSVIGANRSGHVSSA